MAEEKREGVVVEIDLKECYFAREPSAVSNFDQITMRVPAVRHEELGAPREVMCVGKEAQAMIIMFHMVSTCGILQAVGAPGLAAEVEQITQFVLNALEKEKSDDGEGGAVPKSP